MAPALLATQDNVKTKQGRWVAMDLREAQGTDRRTGLLRPQNSPLNSVHSVNNIDLHLLGFLLPRGGAGVGGAVRRINCDVMGRTQQNGLASLLVLQRLTAGL